VVAGALHCCDTAGTLQAKRHRTGRNFTAVTAAEDLDGDGKIEVLISEGRLRKLYGLLGIPYGLLIHL
jgi:hypothetical protein